MVTQAQLVANAANARKGGVKTDEGKAAVRLNAVTHGLTSREALLCDEDAGTLNRLRESMMSELQPQGEIETLIADLIVTDTWQLARAVKVGTGYLQDAIDSYAAQMKKASPETLARLQVESVGWASRGMAVIHDMVQCGQISKLEWYRTAIERHLYRSLQELRQLQQAERAASFV